MLSASAHGLSDGDENAAVNTMKNQSWTAGKGGPIWLLGGWGLNLFPRGTGVVYQPTRRHSPDICNVHGHCYEYTRSHVLSSVRNPVFVTYSIAVGSLISRKPNSGSACITDGFPPHFVYSDALKMEAAGLSETLSPIYRITLSHPRCRWF
jgi:hypothetical protein